MEIIREKINEKMDSRPGALNRAFQQMDVDGSGAIDFDEFKKAILLKGGLIFEDSVLRQVMAKFDDDGTGEIDFRKFCTFVMGSTSRDETGLKTNLVDSSSNVESADGGNSAMMLRRKIRMGAKDIRRAFKDLDRDGSGRLSYDDLRYALHRMDVDLTDRQFEDLMKQIDLTGSQSISYAEFLDFFHREDEGLGLKKITDANVDKAVEIIREKINEKLDSRPGALNRAFQQMDVDGSGAIDFDEFKKAIMLKGGLIFEDSVLRQVMAKFDDDGTGEIDFRKFCTFVMGSNKRDAASILDTQTAGRRDFVSADGGNSEMMLFRKVRMSAKGMRHAFRDIDTMGRGTIPMDDFQYVLHRYDINMGERQLKNLLRKIGASNSSVNWRAFMDYFKQDIAR